MEDLERVLKVIGKNEDIRNKFLDFIRYVEKNLDYKGSVRDDLTKYLIDALFEKDDYVIKTISNGLKFKFLTGINSKIAREFLMSTPEIPEFVWEPQTTKLLLYLAKKSKNVLIGGAYFGDQSIPIANIIKDNKGKVHAFDLNDIQIEMLRENSLMNNLDNIEIVKKGLWKDSNTFLNLSDADDLAVATPSADKEYINTITIDDYLSANNIEHLDVIMIDVEGSEYNILLGAEKQLKSIDHAPNIVFEIHRSYVDWSDGLDNTPILKYLKNFGYKIFSIRDFQGNYDMKNTPIELIPTNETYLEGPPHGFNMLAIKDLSIIDNDLFKICNNVSPKYLIHKDSSLHHPIDGLK